MNEAKNLDVQATETGDGSGYDDGDPENYSAKEDWDRDQLLETELSDEEDEEIMPDDLKESKFWPLGLKFTIIGSIFADVLYCIIFFVMVLFLFILILSCK